MRHDDRLATVLHLAVSAPAMARIQWRQLIDLIGTAPAGVRGDLIDAGYVRLAELAQAIPASARARILAEPGVRLRSPRLLAELARGEPAVAAAALGAARLTPEAWTDLVPALPPVARAMLYGREDLGPEAQALLARLGVRGRGLPAAAAAQESKAASRPDVVVAEVPADVAAPDDPVAERLPPVGQGIGDVVRRIEAFRRARSEPETVVAPGDSPRLPLGDAEIAAAAAGRPVLATFDFVTDVSGRVVWSPPETAPMVIGLSLAAMADETGGRLGDAIRLQQPLRGANVRLTGAQAITGRWQIDAAARFEASGGRYAGHAGRFRRLAEVEAPAEVARTSDRLRQMLHELRTPVNAIQGYAEIIQQQLFGPTPHDYRAYAAAIAADAARMLAGFEELERYARLDTGAERVEPGSGDLLVAFAACVPPPSVSADGPVPAVAVEQGELERLCWRVIAALAGHVAPGDAPTVHVRAAEGRVRAAVALPAALAGMDDAALFAADAAGIAAAPRPRAGMFGTGFALRLAAAEARSAGGALTRIGDVLELALPFATVPAEGLAAAPLTGVPA